MGTYEKEMKLWKEITKNCESTEEYFYGLFTGVWSGTYKYVSEADTIGSKFALAICAKDMETIERLYKETKLSDKEKSKLSRIKKRNADYKQTLNPGILADKYDFLDKYLDLIILDRPAQERLLSLNDKDLNLLKKLFYRLEEYDINPCNSLSKILSILGKRVISAWNRDNKYTYLEFRENVNINELTDTDLDSLIFLLTIDYYFEIKYLDELRNINNELKKDLLSTIRSTDDITELKDDFLIVTYGFNYDDAKDLIKMFDFDYLEEYSDNPAFITYSVIKEIVEEEDIEILRNVCLEFCGMYDYNFIPCRKEILIESLKNIFAKELNKCSIDFSKKKYKEMEGIKIYDAGTEFIVKAKVIGAFSDEGKKESNAFEEWNQPRYSSHINALSLISNDNLAFAQGAEESIILGFNHFDEKMFTTMYHSDNNSVVDSRGLDYNLFYNNVYFASIQKFINKTRNSHNEIDYDRQDYSENAPYFKKNPDYLIFVQELSDIEELPLELKEKQYSQLEKTIQVAKEFGNLPVLIIDREKCAKSETIKIKKLLELFTETKDYQYAKELIIKFGNNRNGTREGHEIIRERYFSNTIFTEIMDIIVNHIKPEDITNLIELLEQETTSMSKNFYDKTFDLPYDYYIEELKNKIASKGY